MIYSKTLILATVLFSAYVTNAMPVKTKHAKDPFLAALDSLQASVKEAQAPICTYTETVGDCRNAEMRLNKYCGLLAIKEGGNTELNENCKKMCDEDEACVAFDHYIKADAYRCALFKADAASQCTGNGVTSSACYVKECEVPTTTPVPAPITTPAPATCTQEFDYENFLRDEIPLHEGPCLPEYCQGGPGEEVNKPWIGTWAEVKAIVETDCNVKFILIERYSGNYKVYFKGTVLAPGFEKKSMPGYQTYFIKGSNPLAVDP